MISNQDLARLETEDLNSLKCHRTDNRRDASRNERFYKDCVAQSPDELDIGSIKHHLDKINTSIAIADLLQNAILARLKWGDEKQENEHHSYHCKMLATRKGLLQQLTATDVHRQSDMSNISVESFEAQPILKSYGTEKALTELSILISNLKAKTHPLKDRPELMENLVKMSKDMTPLWERFNRDNSVSEPASSCAISTTNSSSKFDRLPWIELPSFN